MIEAAVALVGYAGFLVVALVVRTDRLSWVRFASQADALAGAVLAIAVTSSFVSLLLVLLGDLHPWASPSAVLFAGGLLVALGVVVALSAQHQLGPAWRPGIDPRDHPPLVTDSLYRHSRNPFYAGWVMVASGVAALSPTPLSVAGLLGLILSLEIVVRFVEEPALHAAQGQAYVDYARRTRRFI